MNSQSQSLVVGPTRLDRASVRVVPRHLLDFALGPCSHSGRCYRLFAGLLTQVHSSYDAPRSWLLRGADVDEEQAKIVVFLTPGPGDASVGPFDPSSDLKSAQ